MSSPKYSQFIEALSNITKDEILAIINTYLTRSQDDSTYVRFHDSCLYFTTPSQIIQQLCLSLGSVRDEWGIAKKAWPLLHKIASEKSEAYRRSLSRLMSQDTAIPAPPPASNYQPPPASNYQPPPASNYQPPPASNYQPPPASNYQPPPSYEEATAQRTPVSSTPVSSTPVSSAPVSSTPVSSAPVSSAPSAKRALVSAPIAGFDYLENGEPSFEGSNTLLTIGAFLSLTPLHELRTILVKWQLKDESNNNYLEQYRRDFASLHGPNLVPSQIADAFEIAMLGVPDEVRSNLLELIHMAGIETSSYKARVVAAQRGL